MSFQSELITVVDEKNQVIDCLPRSIVRRENLIHRATYIFLSDSKNRICIQKRSIGKDLYPGMVDLACGGTIRYNESYEENAYRELEEELGVSNTKLEHLGNYFFQDSKCRVWGSVYSCTYDGIIIKQDEEIQSFELVNFEDINVCKWKDIFSPDTKQIFDIFSNKLSA